MFPTANTREVERDTERGRWKETFRPTGCPGQINGTPSTNRHLQNRHHPVRKPPAKGRTRRPKARPPVGWRRESGGWRHSAKRKARSDLLSHPSQTERIIAIITRRGVLARMTTVLPSRISFMREEDTRIVERLFFPLPCLYFDGSFCFTCGDAPFFCVSGSSARRY